MTKETMEMNYVSENQIDVSETDESLKNTVHYLLKVGFFGEQFADRVTPRIRRSMK